MPYTRTSGTKSGADAIAYNRDGIFDDYHGKQRDPDEPRYLLMSESNMLPDSISPYEEQMAAYWAHDTHKRHLTEVRRNIISFADDELPADDPRSAERALEIVKAFHEQEYPDRQIAYFVEGGDHKIHVHAHINDWRMSDGKCIDKQKTHARWLAKSFDEFADGYQFADGTTFSLTKENDKNLATLAMNKQDRPYRPSQYERAVADGNQSVINKDGLYNTVGEYIRDTIIQARDETHSYDDYLSYLQDNYITYADGAYLLSQDAFGEVVKRPKTANLAANPKIGEARLLKKYELDATPQGIQTYIDEHKPAPASAPVEVQKPVSVKSEPKSEQIAEPVREPDFYYDVKGRGMSSLSMFKSCTSKSAAKLTAMTIVNDLRVHTGHAGDGHTIQDIQDKLRASAVVNTDSGDYSQNDTRNDSQNDIEISHKRKHDGKAEAAEKAKAAREVAEREQAEKQRADELSQKKKQAEIDERNKQLDAELADLIDSTQTESLNSEYH